MSHNFNSNILNFFDYFIEGKLKNCVSIIKYEAYILSSNKIEKLRVNAIQALVYTIDQSQINNKFNYYKIIRSNMR